MPSDLPTICEVRLRLLREYSAAADSYSTTVRQMVQLVIAGEELRAGDVRRQCRSAWEHTEKTRLALYRHEADHNCCPSAGVRNFS